MLRIMQAEGIAELLLSLPDLVRQQELRHADFALNTTAWLKSLETLLAGSRIFQAGSIAMLRSSLVAAEQGQVPSGIEFRGRPTRSRVLNAVAWQALQRAAEVASSLMAENQPRFSEATRIAQQIISAALSRGLVPPTEKGMSNTQYLRMLRGILITHTDLESAAVHLEGLVGSQDALVLLDRALVRDVDIFSLPERPEVSLRL